MHATNVRPVGDGCRHNNEENNNNSNDDGNQQHNNNYCNGSRANTRDKGRQSEKAQKEKHKKANTTENGQKSTTQTTQSQNSAGLNDEREVEEASRAPIDINPKPTYKMRVGSQNFNGFGPATQRLRDAVEGMKIPGAEFAILIQETRRSGPEILEVDDFVLVTVGRKQVTKGRKQGGGAGILLNPIAVRNWKRNGAWLRRYGDSIIAVRLWMTAKHRGRRHKLHLISSYAPDSWKTDRKRQQHLQHLQSAIDDVQPEYTLLIGTDANARLGTRTHDNSTVGPYGIAATTNTALQASIAGKVHTQLALNGLCAANTFFPARRRTQGPYYTYTTTAGGQRVQIDYIYTRRRDLRKFRTVKVKGRTTIDSDHRRVVAVLNQTTGGRGIRIKRGRLNTKLLLDPDGEHCKAFLESARSHVDNSIDTNLESKVDLLNKALKTAMQMLPPQPHRGAKKWYTESEMMLRPFAAERDKAHSKYMSMKQRGGTPLREARNKRRTARRNYRTALRVAAKTWVEKMANKLNKGGEWDLTRTHTKEAWIIARAIQTGYTGVSVKRHLRIVDPDTGYACNTVTRAAEVDCQFLQHHHSRKEECDVETLARIKQRPGSRHMANKPTWKEIAAIVGSKRNGTGTGLDGIPIEAYKAALNDETLGGTIHAIISRIWCSGSYTGDHVDEDDKEEIEGPLCACGGKPGARCGGGDGQPQWISRWRARRLVRIPKKMSGAMLQPQKLRTLCLSDNLASVVSGIVAQRLQKHLESMLPDSQNGFRWGRGTSDAVWNVKEMLRQRRGAGLSTWVALVDIRTAFDSASRAAIWLIMEKLGVPQHFIDVARRLYQGMTFNWKAGTKAFKVDSQEGTGAGERAGPCLFLVCMLAIMELVDWPENGVPVFVTSKYMAPPTYAKGENFAVPESAFADDLILMFTTREALAKGMTALSKIVTRATCMRVHYATSLEEAPNSKTVAMCCAAPPLRQTQMDTTALAFEADGGHQAYIPFVKAHKYLGVMIHHDGGCERAIEARIAAARKATAMLSGVLRNRKLETPIRGKILIATILPVLLYGSKSWIITAQSRQILNTFYNDTCRWALGVNRIRMGTEGISNADLYRKLAVKPLDYYVRHRQLGWLGNMARMGMHRLPRKLLTSKASNGPNEHRRSKSTRSRDRKNPTPEDDADGSIDDGDSEACMQSDNETADEDGQAASGSDSTVITETETCTVADAGLEHSQSDNQFDTEPDTDDAEESSRVHRMWTATYAPTGRAKCQFTGEKIRKGAIRFTRILRARNRKGSNVERHVSLAGMARAMTHNENKRHKVRGLRQLKPDDRRQVKRILRGTASAQSLPAPTNTPWTCPRCKQVYTRHLKKAKRHATRNECAPRSEVAPPTTKWRGLKEGVKRRGSWLFRLTKMLRKEKEHRICQVPHARCRGCRKLGKQCDRCFFLEIISVARDAKKWDEIVFGAEDDSRPDGHVARSRRARRKPAEGDWEDPRSKEAIEQGLKTLRATAASQWATVPQIRRDLRREVAAARQRPKTEAATAVQVCAAMLHHEPHNRTALAFLQWVNTTKSNVIMVEDTWKGYS